MLFILTCGYFVEGECANRRIAPEMVEVRVFSFPSVGTNHKTQLNPADERNTVKRTTNRTMKRATNCRICGARFFGILASLAIAAALVPGTALAATSSAASAVSTASTATAASTTTSHVLEAVHARATEPTDKVLSYDPADIAAVGTQESTGHSICCPAFSCAYADAVLDGTVRDHSYYGCGCCVWPDWGGGNSSFRCVGTGEQLLREAYDEIAAGKPTVIHVSASYGEHWIALIGYCGATDPDHLTLANFVALDPWDGAQIVASERFALYGDGCEHVSGR